MLWPQGPSSSPKCTRSITLRTRGFPGVPGSLESRRVPGDLVGSWGPTYSCRLVSSFIEEKTEIPIKELIYLFQQQTWIGHLLCAWHCAELGGFIDRCLSRGRSGRE